MKKYISQISLLLAGILIATGLSIANAAGVWNPPCGTPPTCNVDFPLNVGSSPQTKDAALTMKGAVINGGMYLINGNQKAGRILQTDDTGFVKWVDPSQIAEPECIGEGLVWRVNNTRIDDNGGAAYDDHFDVYCRNNIARFCLSNEACPWKTDITSADNLVCSPTGLQGALGAPARNGWLGVSGMRPMASFKTSDEDGWIYGWRGYSAYFCSADGTEKDAYRMINGNAQFFLHDVF